MSYLASAGVQQVSITIGSGATSATATIGAVGSGGHIIWQGFNPSDTSALNDALTRVELTNTTTVTASRGAAGTAQTVTLNAVIIDGDTTNLIKSVQSGTTTIAAVSASATSSISAVTNANTAVNYLGQTVATSSTSLNSNECLLSLSGTTVTASRQATSASPTTGWQVIEYQGTALNSAVQNIADNQTQTGTSNTVTITSVTVGNTFLAFGGMSGNNGAGAGRNYQYGFLTNGTTFTSTWVTSASQVRQFNCSVVEFAAGVLNQSVQRGTIALASSASNTATITGSSTSNGFCNWLNNSNSATVVNLPTSNFQIAQTNTTTLTMTATSAATGEGSYEVVEFVSTSSISLAGNIREAADSISSHAAQTLSVSGRLSEHIDTISSVIAQTYTVSGRLIELLDVISVKVTHTFMVSGQLSERPDAIGGGITVSVSGVSVSGQFIEAADLIGAHIVLSEIVSGRLTEHGDTIGGAVAFTLTAKGKLIEAADIVGSIMHIADPVSVSGQLIERPDSIKSNIIMTGGVAKTVSEWIIRARHRGRR